MSKYSDRLREKKAQELPRNPCKFMKVWMKDGEEEYREIMEAVFDTDEDGNLYEMEAVARVISEVQGFLVTKNDIFKHRHGRCIGCVRMSDVHI